MTGRPSEEEYAPDYAGYVGHVPESDVLAVLERQPEELRALARAVTPERETYRYAAGKWSIRELFGHLGDAERIVGYRAFCISRGDRTPLPGFDETEYMAASSYAERDLAGLLDDLLLVRQANLAVLARLEAKHWREVGNANGSPVSVRALGFMLAGHVRHHVRVLGERYGVSAGSHAAGPGAGPTGA